MSGWEVGDLALCLKTDPWNMMNGSYVGEKPKFNGIYRVTLVSLIHNTTWLEFLDLGWCDWEASNFRKIKPDTEGANEDDAAWLKDLLNKKVKA